MVRGAATRRLEHEPCLHAYLQPCISICCCGRICSTMGEEKLVHPPNINDTLMSSHIKIVQRSWDQYRDSR